MNSDHFFLQRAVALAMRNAVPGGCPEGGPFGAVVVRNGSIIGEGWNQVLASHDPTAHAEVQAIRAACRAQGDHHLSGATLYASSEPCPLCLAAAYWARIARIVFANPRQAAAAIGFCDDDLYCELAQPLTARSLPIEHLPLPDADAPLRRWLDDPQHTLY